MISVNDALSHLFSLVTPLGAETVPLIESAGRVLAHPVGAMRDQPPFAASAMDGYAVQRGDAVPGAVLEVIGEAAAGHRFAGLVAPGQAVRIFTGAPMPAGSDHVVIQEDVISDGSRITLGDRLETKAYVRPRGADFNVGDTLDAPCILSPSDIALLASMNIAQVPVVQRPQVALMATGDELVMPGETPGPDQIIASNSFGLKALLEGLGASVRLLPIARDTETSLRAVFGLAKGCDLIVTIGGASVGDHDLVGKVAGDLGLDRSFYKIAMRPGKPLMAGRMGDRIGGAAMVGLPGNPVSAMVCGQVFLAPMIHAMQGLGAMATARQTARLAQDVPANGPREHYMRARVDQGMITPENRQDSALLSVLAGSNALMIRPVKDAPRGAGDLVEYLPI